MKALNSNKVLAVKILKEFKGDNSSKWDGPNMRITNFEQANQFIKREYRKGWGELQL